MTKTVTVIRRGKPVEISAQVYEYCKRKKRRRTLLARQRHFLEQLIEHFGNDAEATNLWLKNTHIAQYRITAGEMLRRGNLKGLKKFVQRELGLEASLEAKRSQNKGHPSPKPS